ncbi:MAG: endo-1,4-beta-xylanase [Lachnospiraceae bacterium]|nr:endo-1,4-beta-xylanase [Lachnospiraceae bacterium]
MKPMLHKKYKGYFDVGAALEAKNLGKYEEILKQHFNSITPENELKFLIVHPQIAEYNFTDCDKLVEFAYENNQHIRGHTLIWHNQVPDWLFESTGALSLSRNEMLRRMENHIQTIVDRYKDSIYCWDVVNEAIDDGNDFLRNNKWKEIIGDDYIEKAFYYAYEANPKALFFLNEYNCESGAKGDKTYDLIKQMRIKGVPIDGIGIQGHYQVDYPSADSFRVMLEKYSRLGLKIHITELDVSMFSYQDRRVDLPEPSKEMIEKQIEKYSSLFKVFREYKDSIDSVTLWGVADDCTWLDSSPVKERKDWPLLFDQDLNPKEVLYSIINW